MEIVFPVSGVEVAFWVPPAVAFVVSFFTSMGGVSGAFLLLPFQVSVLHFTAPAVSPTNMVYNIVAIPSGVYRYIREGRMLWPLTWIICVGTLPGVVIGGLIRILYLPDPRLFKFFVGCVLLYLGGRLLYQFYRAGRGQGAAGQNAAAGLPPGAKVDRLSLTWRRLAYDFLGQGHSVSLPGLLALSFLVGIVGGTYGIGGGAIIAPFVVAIFGLPVYTIAGAALMSTFLTSIVGVAWYMWFGPLIAPTGMAVTPDWALGALFGAGGFAGMYCGARLQKFVPARWIRLLLGLLILFLSLRYIVQFFV